MNNDFYEDIYTKNIEPLYGEKRMDIDDVLLLKNNNYPHLYSIQNRVDLTNLDVYSIDPDGCLDADDAFSITNINGNITLYIHIADPTEYIELHSDLWLSIEHKIITKYPSNRMPIHLMPIEIMEKSSLMENDYGMIKNAISIKVEIDNYTFLPRNNIQLLFSKIKVKNENYYSYELASKHVENIECFKIGLMISEALLLKRSEKTIGVKLNDLNQSFISYDCGIPYLHVDSRLEKKMKQMIAEFAILANSFIGTYLKIHFDGIGIFRTCDSSLLNINLDSNINGEDLIHEIIVNGIQASYIEKVASHDLVGVDEYIHFTSPIRRASDCICHYLLKYLYLKNLGQTVLNEPFQIEKLKDLNFNCTFETKKFKKIQYKDNKFRYIQIMNLMLKDSNHLKLKYYFTSYKQPFLNLIICNINDFNIYLSYTLKVYGLNIDFNYNEILNNNIINEINISYVNCLGKFDEGSIPELDDKILNFLFLKK